MPREKRRSGGALSGLKAFGLKPQRNADDLSRNDDALFQSAGGFDCGACLHGEKAEEKGCYGGKAHGRLS